ncbi:MAG: hypothetical protein KatS3mg104_1376 [Phycisphaerae bacterium]|jgi:pectate lyase|nr:MAG: hypothetical protein KatS3mg104_1376 [Phycisphaerae bacterium]
MIHTPGPFRCAAPICGFLGAIFILGNAVDAQLVAFPGAEGAGKYSTGGRGGDVYYVQNLNDSGPGSLRYGIQTAGGPRTILFNVSGTIHLLSDLIINKSNLTIAGQTAPGGGITLADRQTRIVNNGSVPTENVIVQYLRFRVGDTYTRNIDNTYEPDALWIAGSRNIMIDHVSASWGVDETLSVTHGSTDVTVQWSQISQSLQNAGHHKGAHGYGSLINGGDITFHHNLYAQHSSRNPRPGDSSVEGQTTRLDFVNNVIANPGFRYGYSGADLNTYVNLVGNYGISGPETSSTSLFLGGGTGTTIYSSGNMIDTNKNGFVDGVSTSGLSGTYTLSSSRANVIPVQTTNARQAYIQVLSRSGANLFRDTIDRGVVRSSMLGDGPMIDSQNEVGGFPSLPSGTPPTDSNGDGVPDYFAIAHGYSPSQNIRNLATPSGYTMLETYLHSLTPNAYTPIGGTTFMLRSVADAVVSENNNSGTTTSSGVGNISRIYSRWSSGGNEYAVLKFDLSSVRPGSVIDARLELTAAGNLTGNYHTLRIYGLEHDDSSWNWDENSVRFSNAPGLIYDGDSSTKGIVSGRLFTLGEINVSGLSIHQTAVFDAANLAVFLNLAAYYDARGPGNQVTLLIERVGSGSIESAFYSRESGDALAPRLVLNATYVPEPSGWIATLSLAGLFSLRVVGYRGINKSEGSRTS